METKITLSNQSQELNIIPLEGFEIDIENSNLKDGKILFRKIKEKYTSEFEYYGEAQKINLSRKYASKLDILDTLLCIRDEYNRIDGFEEGFRSGEDNWCIFNDHKELDFYCFRNNKKIMHFGKKETAELFLKNFEEQLETVKEFL